MSTKIIDATLKQYSKQGTARTDAGTGLVHDRRQSCT